TQFCEENVGTWKMANGDGQRSDVIMMAMSDGDGIDFFLRDQRIERQAGAAFAFGMSAGIHEKPVAVDFRQPGAGANFRVGIEIGNAHTLRPFRKTIMKQKSTNRQL